MLQKASTLLEKQINFIMNEPVKQLLDEYCSFQYFPKGTILFLQSETYSNMYFIINGIMRGYYIDEEGKDVTKCFTCENEFFSTECFRIDSPSSFNIECLGNCSCIQIPYHVLRKAMDEDNNIVSVFNQYTLRAMEDLERRLKDFVMLSAEERYRLFLKQYPKLSQRINQKYIASYIGVRESSLSRIKKSMIPEKLT
jgi:CRP/FNR family transcriptional regulator, anaerobic regulatory protein